MLFYVLNAKMYLVIFTIYQFDKVRIQNSDFIFYSQGQYNNFLQFNDDNVCFNQYE